jgi:hypothetical protein
VLGDRLPAVARAYGFDPDGLREMFLVDSTLVVDENDELLYADEAPENEELVETAPEGTAAAPPTTDPVFALASNPGADHTIYLDFDGHVNVGTSWLSGGEIVSPPYDVDGSPDQWTSTELGRIRATWEAVAEDFAPFDVNVTTIEPSADTLSRSSSDDTTWGTRVVFTSDTAGLCGCGGIAYIGSFDDHLDEPVFVFNKSLTGIVEAATHEVGHAMLLAHDGKGSSTYYGGHGSGVTSWGPIMGAAYNRKVTQWSAGDYFEATNVGPDANYGRGDDDLAILSSLGNGNGFGYRSDDHGDDMAGATSAGTGVFDGIISETTDIDMFAVSSGGLLSISVEPHSANPNLDTHVTVYDGSGQMVAVADDPSQLSSSLELSGVNPATYFIAVDGVGWGTPLSSTITGWTGYGSLGQYTLTITADDGPVDEQPPATPTGLAVVDVSDTTVTLSWNPNGETDLSSYTILRSDNNGQDFGPVASVAAGDESFSDTGLNPGSIHLYAVSANDRAGNSSAMSSPVSATTEVAVISPNTASAETLVYGTITGQFSATWADDGVAQTITESRSGGRPRDRHDRAEHIWQITATDGNHILEVDAEVFDGGDRDTGFDLSWSTFPSGPWTPIANLRQGAATGSFDLGSPSGATYIRVVDTDRSARNTSYDAIAIDMMRLTGGGPVTEAPGQVSGGQPADASTGVSTNPALSWSPASGAAGYTVTVTGVDETLSFTTTTTSLAVDGLVSGTSYQWRVDARNAIGTTTGATWSFTTATPATRATVSSLVQSSVSAGRGTRRAVAEVTVVDDNGAPVSGATVEVQFSGDISENVAGITDGSGRVALTSTSAAKKLNFSSCVFELNSGDAGLVREGSSFDC